VLVNPSNVTNTETTLREVQDTARVIGLSFDILKATTSREIEDAFATMVRNRVSPVQATAETVIRPQAFPHRPSA
jgi:hypothetical protein